MNHRRGILQVLQGLTGRAVRPTIQISCAFPIGYSCYYRTYRSYRQKEVVPTFPARALIVCPCTSRPPRWRHASVTMTATARYPRPHCAAIQFTDHRFMQHRIAARPCWTPVPIRRATFATGHSLPSAERAPEMSGSSVLPCKACMSCKENDTCLKSLAFLGSLLLQPPSSRAVRPVRRPSGVRR
jgi:hypothetical protein